MSSESEPRMHALTVAPALARCGEVVTFTFRLRNDGGVPSPPATVQFALEHELDACDPLEVAIAPTPPSTDLVAVARARVRGGLDDGRELSAYATLCLAGASYRSNRARLRVRTDARLDGSGSGSRLERTGDDTLRATAWCVNQGDGYARDASLMLPVPPGCRRCDGDGPAFAASPRLAPGERLEVAMDAEIETPGADLRADAYVRWNDGPQIALCAGEALALTASIRPPIVRVTRAGGATRLHVTIPNAGWRDAAEVRCAIALGAPLRRSTAAVTVDGLVIPLRAAVGGGTRVAQFQRTDDGIAVVLTRIPARSSAVVECELAAPVNATPSECTVTVGDHVTTAIVAAPPPDLRLRLIDPPRWVERGAEIALAIEVVNAGAAPLRIAVGCDGDLAAAAAGDELVRPRSIAIVRVPARVATVMSGSPGAAVDAVVSASADIVAYAAGDEVARITMNAPVRDDAVLMLETPPMRGAAFTTFAIRNVGTTTARELLLTSDGDVAALEPIGPGARATIDVAHGTVAKVRDAHGRTIELASVERERFDALDAGLRAGAPVMAGVPFPIELTIDTHRALDELVVRAEIPAGCVYVPGSTTIDGRRLAERADGAPLIASLRLGGLPQPMRLRVGCSLIALHAGFENALTIAALLEADGARYHVAPLQIAIEGRDAFAAWLTPQRYFVDAAMIEHVAVHGAGETVAVDDAGETRVVVDVGETAVVHYAAETVAVDGAGETTVVDDAGEPAVVDTAFVYVTLHDGWWADARRLMGRTDDDGLLAHCFVARALFPDGIVGVDPSRGHAVGAASAAWRDVVDRLFVKIRIPGFPVACDDIEDAPARHALRELYAAIASSDASPPREPAGLWSRIDAATARAALTMLTDAARGSPPVLRAIVTLLPRNSATADGLSTPIAAYLDALDNALASFEHAPAAVFERALVSGRYPALDTARRSFIAALDERLARLHEPRLPGW